MTVRGFALGLDARWMPGLGESLAGRRPRIPTWFMAWRMVRGWVGHGPLGPGGLVLGWGQ